MAVTPLVCESLVRCVSHKPYSFTWLSLFPACHTTSGVSFCEGALFWGWCKRSLFGVPLQTHLGAVPTLASGIWIGWPLDAWILHGCRSCWFSFWCCSVQFDRVAPECRLCVCRRLTERRRPAILRAITSYFQVICMAAGRSITSAIPGSLPLQNPSSGKPLA